MTDQKSVPKTTADVLRAAQQELARRGHCKGDMRTADGRVCLYGAIDQVWAEHGADMDMPFYHAAYDEADRLVQEFAPTFPFRGSPWSTSPEWNDADDRTQGEVEKFLLWAADKVEAEELSAAAESSVVSS